MPKGRLEPRVPAGHPWATWGRLPQPVTFVVDGIPVEGIPGEPVAMALWAQGVRVLGWNEESGEPRSLFCTIGHCFECRMTIDGKRDQRACLFPVREGLVVERQHRPEELRPLDGMERL
ncbi:(2Fe-2S)-binding protein [Sulfobacillus harzensis]|uniref:(2Fe-2S)-binding protein n=1 Tax=Sulfobacillus harzensis TaxID=2729629 RepID=A0A7Y0Q0V0_9FIRM|nr:(2Fe-2S)-binding protein [Sulfobacillus harzensis]NMP21423.1 (2Fe-2S)-binding protein [Sulfobacillus harzensis]